MKREALLEVRALSLQSWPVLGRLITCRRGTALGWLRPARQKSLLRSLSLLVDLEQLIHLGLLRLPLDQAFLVIWQLRGDSATQATSQLKLEHEVLVVHSLAFSYLP